MDNATLFPLIGILGIVVSSAVTYILVRSEKTRINKLRVHQSRSTLTTNSSDSLSEIDNVINQALDYVESLKPRSTESNLEEKLKNKPKNPPPKPANLDSKLKKLAALNEQFNSNSSKAKPTTSSVYSSNANNGHNKANLSDHEFRKDIIEAENIIEKVYTELPNQTCITEKEDLLDYLSKRYDLTKNRLNELSLAFEKAKLESDK